MITFDESSHLNIRVDSIINLTKNKLLPWETGIEFFLQRFGVHFFFL